MKYEELIKKFVDAFNQGYPSALPSITVTDVDDSAEPSKEIFTPLASTFAVLYYQQLCHCFPENTQLAVKKLLQGSATNEMHLMLFQAQYWGEWPCLTNVESTVKDRLEDIQAIKYRLFTLEDERNVLQDSLNELSECVNALPIGTLQAASVTLIQELQTQFDDYVAQLIKCGVTIPITGLQHLDIAKAARKVFLDTVTSALQQYQQQFSAAADLPETRSLWQRLSRLFIHFLTLLRQWLAPHPQVSATFFKPEQAICRQVQEFGQRCEKVLSK